MAFLRQTTLLAEILIRQVVRKDNEPLAQAWQAVELTEIANSVTSINLALHNNPKSRSPDSFRLLRLLRSLAMTGKGKNKVLQ